MAPDPINLAIARAAQAAAPKRFAGQLKLPSGAVAMVDLPAPMTMADALAFLAGIVPGVVQLVEPPEKTPEQAARERLVLPS